MDPNSQHQTWSLWVFKVIPGDKTKHPSVQEVKWNCWKFGRQPEIFGQTGQMHVERVPRDIGEFWIIKYRVEGKEVFDPQLVKVYKAAWAKFFTNGFGAKTYVECEVKHEAGDKQDGKPPDQLIIIPPVNFKELAGLKD